MTDNVCVRESNVPLSLVPVRCFQRTRRGDALSENE
jgi:hypothetical protein